MISTITNWLSKPLGMSWSDPHLSPSVVKNRVHTCMSIIPTPRPHSEKRPMDELDDDIIIQTPADVTNHHDDGDAPTSPQQPLITFDDDDDVTASPPVAAAAPESAPLIAVPSDVTQTT